MKTTQTMLTLSLLLCAGLPTASSAQEMFRDRFGNWHYTDPNMRNEQGPYLQPRPDLYQEFVRERRRQENEYIYNEYRRYRDCSYLARRC